MRKDVLNEGFVELLDFMGSDLTVANSARVSFAKRSSYLSEADEKLIGFLYRNRHATPFEHVTMTWHVKCPIFVAREWMRHRAASYNEMSMRYHVPDELDFWMPSSEDWRTQVGKPGAYTFEPFSNLDIAELFAMEMKKHFEHAENLYRQMIAAGVAKEIARSVIPVAQYTEFYFTVNVRNLMNFLSLRNHPDAQKEIRLYAQAMEDIWAKKMPVTHQAFVDAGRIGI